MAQAKQTIGVGTVANDGTGDPIRSAFQKVNANFDDLYNGELVLILDGNGAIVGIESLPDATQIIFVTQLPVVLTVSRALADTDNGKTLCYFGSANITLTVLSGYLAGFGCAIYQGGTGQITLLGSGATVSNVNGQTKTASQHAVLALLATGTDTYVFTGQGA